MQEHHSRRQFLLGSLATTTGLMTYGLHPLMAQDRNGGDRPDKKLNVLFLFTDDQKADFIGALGQAKLKTPNMDRLVERGYTFHNTYCMGSMQPNVCMPARYQVLTGMNVLSLGFRYDKRRVVPRWSSPSFPEWMDKAGYVTVRSGKSGSEAAGIAKRFDENTSLRRSPKTVIQHVDNVIDFIERHDEKPFFAYIAFGSPHDPQHATEDWYKAYSPDEMPLPETFLPLHPFDNGEMTIRDEKTLPWPRTEQAVKQKLARYHASTSHIDQQVGRLLDALEKTGKMDNTLVIFSSDNGLSMGDHGLLGKQNLYEYGGMHVPLIFAGPGVPHGQTDSMAYLHDIFPTACELAGLQAPEELDGKSLAPVIRGEREKARTGIFTCYRDVQRAFRDERWKIIRYPKIDHTQLFDLQNDPREKTNLADDPQFAGKVKEMLGKLAAAQKQVGDSCPLTVASPAPKAWTPPTK